MKKIRKNLKISSNPWSVNIVELEANSIDGINNLINKEIHKDDIGELELYVIDNQRIGATVTIIDPIGNYQDSTEGVLTVGIGKTYEEAVESAYKMIPNPPTHGGVNVIDVHYSIPEKEFHAWVILIQ